MGYQVHTREITARYNCVWEKQKRRKIMAGMPLIQLFGQA